MAVKKKLGTIQQITDLREIWGHEATDFTPWLAENIDLLNEATGLNLEVLETEAQVGNFSVDILAQDAIRNRKPSSRTNWKIPIMITLVSYLHTPPVKMRSA